MRIRATVAAVSGALALSAIALPAAQADENLPQAASHAAEAAQSSQTAAPSSPGAKAKKSFHAATDTPGKFTAAVVNGGKPVAVGTKAPQTYKVSVTAKDDSGVGQIFAYLWRGTSLDDPKSIGVAGNESRPSCKEVNATTSTCTMTVTFDPYVLENSNAGTWRVGAAVMTKDGELVENDSIAKTVVQRFSKLTVNASPEPVKKGKTITVTGQLTRANWDTYSYQGYGKQSVKLQFLKKGAKSYTTVKTVKTSSTGALKTTVKASADGSWRYSFAGTSTTPAVASGADYLDVK